MENLLSQIKNKVLFSIAAIFLLILTSCSGGGGSSSSSGGNTGGGNTPVIATATPSTPDLDSADDSAINTDNITNQTTALTFKGTAPADSTVELFVDGTATGITATATGGVYSIDLNLAAGSTYAVSAVATAAGADPSSASAALNVTIDNAPPVISGTSPVSSAGRNNTLINYILSENISSGSVTWTRTGGSVDPGSPHVQALSGSELSSGSHINIMLTNNPALVSGGVYSVSFDAVDAAGNASGTVTSTGVTFDNVVPVFSSVLPASSSYVNNTKVSYTLSETLATGTITWTGTSGSDNGVVHSQALVTSDLASGTHNNYNIANPPVLVDGSTYTISFDGQDLVGNAASSVSVTGVVFDTTAPANQNTVLSASALTFSGGTVTIASSGNSANTVWLAPAGLTLASQFTADATHTSAGGSATSITAPVTAGTYYLYVIDAAGNVSASSTAAVTVDATPPSVTINQAAGQSDPATSLPINFTVVFSEAVDPATFSASDITQNGTATGVIWGTPSTSDNITWSVSATSANIAGGTIVPSIAAGAVNDLAGNSNTVSSSTDNSVTYTSALTVSINQAAGQSDPVNVFPVSFTIVFNSAINPATFTASDITQTGTATGVIWSAPTTADNITWTVTATAGGQGTYVPTIAAGAVQDASLRNNDVSTSTDNSVTYEIVKPNVTINQAAAQVDPTNVSTINFTIVFSEAINPASFTSADFTLGGTGTYTMGTPTTSDNITWNVAATATADGTINPSIGASKVTDVAGNANNASTSTDAVVTYDTIAPASIITGAPTGTNNINALSVTVSGTGVVTYQYAVGTGIICSAAAYSADIPVSTVITDNISALADGTVTLCVLGKDSAGNLQASASATSASWTKSSTLPTATIAGAPSGINNTTLLNITIGGTSITEYQYAVGPAATTDCATATYTGGAAPGGGILVSSAITDNISGLADGLVKLCVLGYLNPSWQTAANASVATWTKQTTPPSLVANGAETLDLNQNGKIDHIRLTFSSPVDDTTFPGYVLNSLGSAATGWSVGAYTGAALRHGSAVSAFSGGTVTDTPNDSVLYLSINEIAGTCDAASQAGCDTGVVPDVTMTSQALKDTIGTGNLIALISSATVAEKDSANPVLAGTSAPSNITLNVFFSENVTAASAECGAGSSQSAVACSSIYTLDGGLTVNKAVMAGGVGINGNNVVLTTSTQTDAQAYILTVASGVVKDVNNLSLNSPSNIASFAGSPAATNLISASSINNTTVELVFNVPVTAVSAEIAGNYSIPGLSVTAAQMYPAPGTDGTTVRLTTSSQLSSSNYTITVASGSVTAVSGGLTCNNPNNTGIFAGDTLPTVQSTASLDQFTVDVIFSEFVLMDTSANGALNIANYTINGSAALSVTNAVQLSNVKVRLTTATQVLNDLYTVTVNNVMDVTAPAGNLISATGKTGTFLGQENIKILNARHEIDASSAFDVFSVTFSKPFLYGVCSNAVYKTETDCTANGQTWSWTRNSGGTNAVDNLVNWTFPGGLGIVSICTSADDAVCPNQYTSGVDTVIYFKASPAPSQGAYTVVASANPSANCIKYDDGLTNGGVGCLRANPDDRASVDFGLPTTVASAVYTDPFNDTVTMSGQVVQYNGKLLIGPNNTDSGLFQTDINMQNATSITLDADNLTPSVFEAFAPPLIESGTQQLAGIDYLYTGCYDTTGTAASSLTGTACTSAGGTEYLFVLGFNQGSASGYQSNWNTTSTVSPFIFNHIMGLSTSATRTFRAMSINIFKGWIYQASQHQNGSRAVRWNRFTPDGLTKVDLRGDFLNRIGAAGTIPNGQHNAARAMNLNYLVSIDTMYEYDNDGAGANASQMYIANGGSCLDVTAPNRCLQDMVRNATTQADGGVLRSVLASSTQANPPVACTNAANCDTMWEDVTPTSTTWLRFMSIALPQDAEGDGVCGAPYVGTFLTDDWDCLQPANTITPAIKAIPKMANFNGDLYMIRNSCASATVTTLSATVHKTCPAGSERPQLWRLPANAGTTAAAAQSAWQFVGNATSFMTQMDGAYWVDGAGQSQAVKTASNTEVTLLVVNGGRLYIGFDNAVYGLNIWRTKAGVTNPTSEADFEAVCATGNACSDPSKQFGLGQTTANSRIFDGLSVNDAGTDYLIMNVGDGINPLKIYRTTNN